MARILKYSDCAQVNLFTQEVLDIISQCFIDYSNKKCNLKPKIVLRKDNASFFTTMPAIYNDLMSVKSIQRDITVNQPSIRGMLILNDNISGNLLSIMDSSYLTAVRTGLTAYLSLKTTTNIIESKTVSVIGIGNTMIAFLKALQSFKSEHNIRVVYVKEYKDHLSKVKNVLDKDFDIIPITNDELMNADIIVSAITSADGAIVKEYHNDWKAKTIIPIHVRGWEHFDNKVDIITTDFYEQTKEWIRSDAIELGDLLSKEETRNKLIHKDSNIMSYNYGGGLVDLVIANYIYNKAIELELGIELNLWDMKSRYI
ncbi:hypothetical protein [Photobacterium damselae]|uniref:hypothetical protein n=1 Tax=Photobacterium damselae TaxID=38293 RepID=UPI002543AE96